MPIVTVAGAPNQIAPSTYKVVYGPANGITISAAPALSVGYGGAGGQLTGTASLAAGFSTDAAYYLGLSTSGYQQGYTSTVSVKLPTFTSSSFYLKTNTDVTFSIEPSVYWLISWGIPSVGGLTSTFYTPFQTDFGFKQSKAAAKTQNDKELLDTCSTTQEIKAAATVTTVGVTIGSTNYPLSITTNQPTMTVVGSAATPSDSSTCMATATAPPPGPPAPGTLYLS